MARSNWVQVAAFSLLSVVMVACSESDDAGTSAAPLGGTGGAAGEGGGAGTSGTGGTSGEGGGGQGGDTATVALDAADLTWTWLEVPGTVCRDGSVSGIGYSLNSASDKLMIFLEGGGACFNASSCLLNPANDDLFQGEKTQGVFSRTEEDNPVKDWNWIYVPYCTGDVHGGTKDDGAIPGIDGVQHFMGRRNLETILDLIVPKFSNVSQVLLTGISAGGFGASVNAELVGDAFGDEVDLVMIDDSGPAMGPAYVPPCLQTLWNDTWGFDDGFLASCGDACPSREDYSIDYLNYLADKYPDRPSGLIASTADGTITLFYGYGQNDCAATLLPSPLPAEVFEEGILDFRTRVQDLGLAFGTFYFEGTAHTSISAGAFYAREATMGGVRLVDWFRNVVEGGETQHVGP